MPQTCRRRYQARRRLGFRCFNRSRDRIQLIRILAGDIDAWLRSTRSFVTVRSPPQAKPTRLMWGIKEGRIVAIGESLADADEVVEAAASMSDRCGSVPSIKFEDAVSRNTR